MANQENSQSTVNPPSISFGIFLLRLLAGLAGGISGSLILLLIFMLSSSVLDPITHYAEGGEIQGISPIFTFILLMMIFLGSTVGNILSTWLTSLTQREKYTRISSAIYQTFILSIIMFVLMAPVYFIAAANNITIVAYAVALHIIISAQVSALVLEVVSNYRYALVGLYGITFAVLISAGIMFGLAGIVASPQILLFAALPIVWGSISFVQSIFAMLYGWMARTYDKDFLCTETVYGNDYGKEVEVEEPEPPKAKDEAGADFLRHN